MHLNLLRIGGHAYPLPDHLPESRKEELATCFSRRAVGKEAGTFRKMEHQSSVTLKVLMVLRSSALYFQLQETGPSLGSRSSMRVMGTVLT